MQVTLNRVRGQEFECKREPCRPLALGGAARSSGVAAGSTGLAAGSSGVAAADVPAVAGQDLPSPRRLPSVQVLIYRPYAERVTLLKLVLAKFRADNQVNGACDD
jgi:hypothetical protein